MIWLVLGFWLAALVFLLTYPFARVFRWRAGSRWRWPWLMGDVGWVACVGLVVGGVEAFQYAAYTGEWQHAEIDLDRLESALEQYEQHMNHFPATLGELEAPATNARGETARPFLTISPAWFAQYRYQRRDKRGYWVTTSDQHHIVHRPRGLLLGWRVFERQTDWDLWTLATAVEKYRAHTGKLPDALSSLTSSVTNANGESAGPFLKTIPGPPAGWSAYRYERRPDGDWSISTTGTISVTDRRYLVGVSPSGKWVGIVR